VFAYILLRGKDFAIPEPAAVAVIGLFFGLVAGLFYYQHYLKTWYWAISLAGGIALASIFRVIFERIPTADDTAAIEQTIASFAIPLALTILLNHGLYMLKRRKRKQREHRKRHSKFFDSVNAGEALRKHIT
jgi:O-antigen/teichoic acid export membrane protein